MLDAAIVGLGSWGRTLVYSVQGKSERIRFVRAVTRTPASAQGYAAAIGLPLSDDFGALLKDRSVDALVLATPHSQHVEQVKAAARAGKHVLVEKPLAVTRAEAEEAVKACRRAGVTFGVAHNRRFLPATRRLQELARDGALGRLLHVEGNMSGPSGRRHTASNWRADPSESPAGGMTGKGVHLLDLMISLFGPVKRADVRSLRQVMTGELDDTTSMLLDFESGATGYLATITATPDVWRLQAFGTKGWAEMRGTRYLAVRTMEDGQEDIESFDEFDTVRAELEAFADAVAGIAPYPIPNEEVVAGAAALEAIVESAREGRPVDVPAPAPPITRLA